MLKGTIATIKNDSAVLRLEDGQTLAFPLSEIGESVAEGSDVRVFAIPLEGGGAGSRKIAKHLLEELIGTPS